MTVSFAAALRAKLIAIALAILSIYNWGKLPSTHPLVIRYESAAADVLIAIDAEMPGATEDEKEQHARALFVWGYYEGSWNTNPMGSPDGKVKPGTNDDGRACGVMQLHVTELAADPAWKTVLDPTWSCIVVRKDRVIGFRAALRVLLELERRTGCTLGQALNAYSTDLVVHPWIAYEVRRRCKIGGISC